MSNRMRLIMGRLLGLRRKRTPMTPGATQTVGPVVFDYQWFQTRYPHIAEWTSPGMAQGYFERAQTFLDNTGAGSAPPSPWCFVGSLATGGIVQDIPTRQVLFGLLVAHIAMLNSPMNGAASSGLIGRITSASEGSVSVSTDYPDQPPGAAWFNQTKYGAEFWNATARFRTGGLYFPGRNAGYNFFGGRGIPTW